MTFPDAAGRFGGYGGRYVPEALIAALDELTAAYEKAMTDEAFQAEFNRRRQEVWGSAADRLRTTLGNAVRIFRRQLRSQDERTAFRAAQALLQIAGSSRLALPPHPDLAPPDPAGVLDLEARKVKIELASVDPRTDPIYDEDRALALRRLLHKNTTDPRPAQQEEELR